MAHVLFLDLVRYATGRSLGEQAQLVTRLQEVVRQSAEFRRAEASGDLRCLPTGDGMALVFFRDPVAPAQCATELARSLRDNPDLPVRMGIHSGPVTRIQDINANLNVAGGGINLAQRVMDCGDAGHILVSRAAAELLQQVGEWPLHDLGECELKYGDRIHLFNLYSAEVGNPRLPERLRGWRSGTTAAGEGPGSISDLPAAVAGPRVALLYKRDAQPDAGLLELLEARFTAAGCSVFVDRNLPVGVEWARAIEREVRGADVVVPLLSAASIGSEMLAHEVQVAWESAQELGRPRILPVRVNYTGPLPEALGTVLDPLVYSLWEGAADDERRVAELRRSLAEPPAARPEAAASLEPAGGAMRLDSRFYVVRPTDEEFRAAIARGDSIVLVKGARQMGKTSLLARGLQQARARGARLVLTDFQKLNAAHLESVESLMLALADSLADQLDLGVLPDEAWNARRGPSVNFERYVRREALGSSQHALVWGMDEVDRLFAYPFASEVFGLFRSWHNERALDPEGPWSRLTLAIAYATEAHLFITDLNQSPFNVGTRLTLDDLTFPQVADLNTRYGSPLRDETEIARFYRLLNGHPYLTQRGLLEMATHGSGINTLEGQAALDEGIFGDHLRRILVLLARDEALADVVRGGLRGEPCATQEAFYRLRSAGVMAGDSPRTIRPRCQLYAVYLERHLL